MEVLTSMSITDAEIRAQGQTVVCSGDCFVEQLLSQKRIRTMYRHANSLARSIINFIGREPNHSPYHSAFPLTQALSEHHDTVITRIPPTHSH